MPNAPDLADHVSPDTIAAFAEGRIAPDLRDTVERHLASCPECRRDVAHIVRMRRRPVRRWAAPVIAAASAAALLFIVIGRPESGEPPNAPVVRASPEPGASLGVVTTDSVMGAGTAPSRFTWRSLDEGARYTFTLATEGGDRIFSTGTADTTMVLPAEFQLAPGRTYLWFVDAVGLNGQSASTGVRVVRTLP